MNATIAQIEKAFWPVKFEQLHRDYYDWLSQVDFWKYELRHMENAMKQFLCYPLSKGQAGKMRDIFNRFMADIKPEIREIEGWVRAFHRQLAHFINPEINGQEPRRNGEHRRLFRKMKAFRQRLALLKQQLYRLLSEVLRQKKAASHPHRAIWAYRYSIQLRQSG